MQFQRERSLFRDAAGSKVLELMDEHGAFVAGGAITSVFSSEKINDLDLFFRSADKLQSALASVPSDQKTVDTESALSFVADGRRIQLIRVLTGTPEDVIRSFDFTICQGAFSEETGFVLGSSFLHHLAQRRLVFNLAAEYPICSLYRARKFIRRGYHFSGIEAIKLGLKIQNLKLSTLGELKKQLMGIDTLFLKDLTDSLKGQEEKAYDLNDLLAMLEPYMESLDTLAGAE
jgi:hypothetical protein